MIVGNFAGEDMITAELAHDDAGVADDFAGATFDRFLVFGVAVEKIDDVFEARGGDVVKKAGEGLFAVVGETPDDEGDAEVGGRTVFFIDPTSALARRVCQVARKTIDERGVI